MRRRIAVALAALTVLFGACGVRTEGQPRLLSDDKVPFDLLRPDAAPLVPNASAPVTEPVTLCFVKDEHLVTAPRVLDSPVEFGDVVGALAETPNDQAGLRTALGGPRLVERIELQGGVLAIDLTPEVATLGGNDQLFAIAQIVCSLTARPGVGQIAFTLAGAPVDVPRADGSLTSGTVSRDDYAALIL